MNVLILTIHYPVASGRYVLDALQRLGHDVRSLGPTTGRNIWGMQIEDRYVWPLDYPPEGWNPDVVLIMDSNLPGIEKTWECLTAVYGVDNHVRDYHQFDAITDHFFLAHGHGARIGEPNVSWLPCGYDPVWFTPGKSWSDRTINSALIGVPYIQRAELLGNLLGTGHHGIEYHLAVYDQYAAIYQNAKISLVASFAHDVAQRVWETAAMGCLVLMDECPDCAALGLVDGTNCLIYHSFEEALAKYDWALSHEDEAAQIAAEGQAWASHGTWDARAQVIMEWAEAQRQPKKATGKK